MSLMKSSYNRLGSHDLLEKCLGGYTQNANEALHQLVWKLCPKHLFLGTSEVKCGASLAVCQFNDGVSSFFGLAESLGCNTSSKGFNNQKYSYIMYKERKRAKTLRKQC